MKVFLIVGGLLLTCAALLLVPFYFVGAAFETGARYEVARLKSPSGEAEAVIVEGNGGATTSFSYEVHLLKSGEKLPGMSWDDGKKAAVAYFYGATTPVHYGLILNWRAPDSLVIAYQQAKVAEVHKPTVGINGRTFYVQIEQSDADTAPTGGLLYACCQPGAPPH